MNRYSQLLSVVMITLNEEERLEACLKSLPHSCEIIILDSRSTDRTVEIAEAAGARVFQREFDDYASQKNAAIDMATGRWVLSLDADEILTPGLAHEIMKICENPSPSFLAYRIERRLVFSGRRLRFGKSRDYPVRLFLNGSARFHNEIHEQLVVAGRVGRLYMPMDHHSYRNLNDYFRRFNEYTSRIAESRMRKRERCSLGLLFLLRPWLEFISRYFLRLGFLDGYPGYCYALVSSLYAFVKYAKLLELYEKEKRL